MAWILSILLLTGIWAVSVSYAHAEEPQPTELVAPLEPDASEALHHACKTDETAAYTNTAAYAAQLLRYEQGLLPYLPEQEPAARSRKLLASFDAAHRVMETALSLDLTAFTNALQPFDGGVYAEYAKHAAQFTELANELNSAIDGGASRCMRVLSRDLRAIEVPFLLSDRIVPSFSWQETAALYRAFGDELLQVLAQAVEVKHEGDLARGVTMVWGDPTFDEAIKYGTQTQIMSAKFALAYLRTAFDDEGSEKTWVPTVLDKAYLATIAHPLPGCHLKDGWYLPRSRGTRLHMGTDILASRSTPILSATDGVVLYIGTMATPGNYVVVRDPYGYEYHYYHMVERSKDVQEGDLVKQGQIIGRVGSTGNSAANHLHLAIISPAHIYLNPYDVYVQAGIA